MVDISDALSERDRVKFTVHTKVRAINLILHMIHDVVPCYSLVSLSDRDARSFVDNSSELQGKRIFRSQGTRGVCLAPRPVCGK